MDICNQVFKVTTIAIQQQQHDGSEYQQQERDVERSFMSSSLVSSSEPDFQSSTCNSIYVAASDPDTAKTSATTAATTKTKTTTTVENIKNQDIVHRQSLLPTGISVSANTNSITQAEEDYAIAKLCSAASKSSSKSPYQESPACVQPPDHMSLDVTTSSEGAAQHCGGRKLGVQRTHPATMRCKSLPPSLQNEEAALAAAAHGAVCTEARPAHVGEHAAEVAEPTEAEQEDYNNNESLQEHQPKPDQSTENDAGERLIQSFRRPRPCLKFSICC
jgi:hypothetical protein